MTDPVEYCVLLHHLFRSGINGKTWRIIRSFYTNPRAQVRSGNGLSEVINLERGVRQGSVLSPLLFQLVMDSLLIDLAHALASIGARHPARLCHVAHAHAQSFLSPFSSHQTTAFCDSFT